MLAARVAYFDLSLQHVSRPLLARMRRWGDGERFVERIEAIRSAAPEATFRSSFILGYPGETEEDHDRLLEFLRAAELDWAGFFTFSPEDGTYAEGLGDQVPAELALERLRECAELQDAITAQRRDALVGAARQVLIDAPGIGRTIGEAPEIDGIVRVDPALPVGRLVDMVITASLGTDLEAVAATALAHQERVPAGRGQRDRHRRADLRAVGTRHAGQRHHHRPAAVHALFRRAHRRPGRHVAHRGGGRRRGVQRRYRRLRRPPPGDDALGAFLDPLADKVVVLSSLFALAAEGHLPWIPILLIAAREVYMSVYRSFAGRQGVSIPARNSAKLKTLVQDFSIAFCVLPPTAHLHGLQLATIWLACALTLFTGAQYYFDGRRALHGRAA